MSSVTASPWNHAPERHWPEPPPWLQMLDRKPFWIAATVLGFIYWWPVGLALLIFMIGSGRMGCGFWRHQGAHRHWSSWCNANEGPGARTSSGNRAFDEYRAETLRRLEEEQREFAAFLDRLRFAKDKSEFDDFMAQRRQPPSDQPQQV